MVKIYPKDILKVEIWVSATSKILSCSSIMLQFHKMHASVNNL